LCCHATAQVKIDRFLGHQSLGEAQRAMLAQKSVHAFALEVED
jgi:hypothetical protein